MPLPNGMHLGKQPPRLDPRTLQYAKYRLTTALPAVPPGDIGHEGIVADWPMCGNGPDDSVYPGFQGAGDCVFAGGDHETQLWTTEGGTPAAFNGSTAISDYSAVTGYNPDVPSSDQGTDVLTALNYRRNTGLLDLAGNRRHKIGAFLAMDVSRIKAGDFGELYEALYLFDTVAIGINFPDTAMNQFDTGQIWDVVSGAAIEGGHYIPLTYIYADGTMDVVTWAKLQRMTAAFLSAYCDEAYAILSPEMLKGGISIDGFDLAQLQADLAALDTAPAPPAPVPPDIDTVVLTIGDNMCLVNGYQVMIDDNPAVVPAIGAGDRTMIPCRFVAESMGADVIWNAVERSVTITFPRPLQPGSYTEITETTEKFGIIS